MSTSDTHFNETGNLPFQKVLAEGRLSQEPTQACLGLEQNLNQQNYFTFSGRKVIQMETFEILGDPTGPHQAPGPGAGVPATPPPLCGRPDLRAYPLLLFGKILRPAVV